LKDLSLTVQALLSNYNPGLQLSPAAKQIELDLLRTLPNNKHYESPHSSGPVFFKYPRESLTSLKERKRFTQNKLKTYVQMAFFNSDVFWNF
jgi:hypothetical protein